jgi:RNA polymerase subunit RPABC4/transcription elongation factor Spt4
VTPQPQSPHSSAAQGVVSEIDVTPDQRILKVLAAAPLNPIDALCELIDNSLDSFDAARKAGVLIPNRWIRIFIPKPGEIENGGGVIRISDNGIGLDKSGLTAVLTAAFSSKNKFDALGLFGIGFNIATAKLGKRTTVTSARPDPATDKLPPFGLVATLDIPKLISSKTFKVQVGNVPNPTRGTTVEVSGWWPPGDPNEKFAFDLAKSSRQKLLEQLGRRYSTVIRDEEKSVTIFVNDNPVVPFEHCVWSEDRSIVRQEIGRIPARIFFNETLAARRRCEKDGIVLPQGMKSCPECGGDQIRQVPERIHGWIGVQRWDHKSEFGIDLIRNGRAIRVAEKDAFFTYTDEYGNKELEYPIDQLTGRIVGEVHLDHVPVTYNKQHFELQSEEWLAALSFLRGGGLTEKNRRHLPAGPDGKIPRNNSPIGRIFDGYRRVKKFGVIDMYMGTYVSPTKSERISRDTEENFKERFRRGEPGYRDDSEWWKLVEAATVPPSVPMARCSDCGAEHTDGALQCLGCGKVLVGKNCIACGQLILHSAGTCPMCGESQGVIEHAPWACAQCEHRNGPDDEACGDCGLEKGQPNPMSRDALVAISSKSDELSFETTIFNHVDGSSTDPIAVSTYVVPPQRLRTRASKPSIPTYSPPSMVPGIVEVFVDRNHPFFTVLGCTPEFAVSSQVATVLQAGLGSATKNGKSALNLTYRVLEEVFGESLSITESSAVSAIEAVIGEIVDRIARSSWGKELRNEILPEENEALFEKLHRIGRLESVEQLKSDGLFLKFVPAVIPRLFAEDSDRFQGVVFRGLESQLSEAPVYGRRAKESRRRQVRRALEECTDFLESPTQDNTVLQRVRSSAAFLESQLA